MNSSDIDSFKEVSREAKWKMDVQHLRNAIQAEIDLIDVKISKKMSDEDLSCSSDIDSWNDQKTAFQNLLAMDIKNRIDFETVKWLFNSGNLRTEEELERFSDEFKKHENKIKKEELQKTTKYGVIQALCQMAIIWVPIALPIIAGIVMCIIDRDFVPLLGNIFAVLFGEAILFIPLEIIITISSILILRAVDKKYKVEHDSSEDLVIAGVAAGMITTYYIQTKNKKHTNKEI